MASQNNSTSPLILNTTIFGLHDLPKTLTDINKTNSAEIYGKILADSTVYTFYVLYLLVLIFGISGNVVTFGVILNSKQMRRSIHFYTVNLVACDFLILLFYVPTQLSYIKEQMSWKIGPVMCKVSYFILPIALVCTIGTLLAITIDRARGMVQPFKWRADSKKAAVIAIPIIWMVSLLLNIPMFIVPKLVDYDGMITCSEEWPGEIYSRGYWIGMFLLTWVIPLIFIFLIHVMMVVVLRKEVSIVHRNHVKQMMHLTIAVVVVFSVCTGFQHVYFFLEMYAGIEMTIQQQAVLYCTSNFVVTTQAALNPVIYGTFRQDLKKAFKLILWKATAKLKVSSLCAAEMNEPLPCIPSYCSLDSNSVGHKDNYARETLDTSNCEDTNKKEQFIEVNNLSEYDNLLDDFNSNNSISESVITNISTVLNSVLTEKEYFEAIHSSYETVL